METMSHIVCCRRIYMLNKNNISTGVDHQDELDADGVPPYEDRLGPDGAEGENPILPQVIYNLVSLQTRTLFYPM